MSALAVQLERPGSGSLELSREGLEGYAEALASAWSTLGVGAGDRVAIYDHGSSPAAYLASAAFIPYLARGAAERLGATALCIDGLPDNAKRFAHVLRHFRPRFAFVRTELAPLLVGGPTAVPAELRAARLVIGADGDVPGGRERQGLERGWTGGVSVLARCDAAAFLAADCPRCGLLRVPGDLYEARVTAEPSAGPGSGGEAGALTVRPRFLDLGARFTELTASAVAAGGGCSHGGFALA